MAPMSGGWVYIVTNKPRGTLYVGVTSDIQRRAWEHREGIIDGFTKRYGLKLLVYAERYEEIGASNPARKTQQALITRLEDQADT
jgi:putative endonuclease